MTDNLTRQTQGLRPARLALSLDDLLLAEPETGLSDYLSLSLSTCGDHTKISITTTGTNPVTYSAFILASAALDLNTLVFVAQPLKLGELSDHRSVPEKRKACVRIARLAPFWSGLRSRGLQRRR